MLPLPAISPCSTAEAVAQQWNSLDAYEKWNKAHLTLSCLWIDSLFNQMTWRRFQKLESVPADFPFSPCFI